MQATREFTKPKKGFPFVLCLGLLNLSLITKSPGTRHSNSARVAGVTVSGTGPIPALGLFFQKDLDKYIYCILPERRPKSVKMRETYREIAWKKKPLRTIHQTVMISR